FGEGRPPARRPGKSLYRRRTSRRFTLSAFAAFAVVPIVIFAMTSAKATYSGGVQDTGLFELDRDTLPSTCPRNDFAGLYTVGGTNPCGSDGFAFVPDGVASADTTYWAGGGSKDAYDPALGPWMWSSADVAPSKDDIDNAFAAKYTLTSGTDKTPFIFFGADRFATSGDAQM